MDTRSLLAILLLVLAGVVLAVVAASEASVSALGRLRSRPSDDNDLHARLRGYVRQRHRILRSLSAASSVGIVIVTTAITVLVLGGSRLDGAEMLGVVVLAAASAVVLRQSARMFALQGPEAAALRLAGLIRLIDLVFGAVAWGGSLPARLVLRLIGRDPERGDPTPAQELLDLLELEEESDALAEERRMMRGILEMGEQSVREIMSARTDLTAVSTDASIGDAMRLVSDTGFSRIPLYEEDIDHIVGVVYAKDLIAYLQRGDVAPALRDVAIGDQVGDQPRGVAEREIPLGKAVAAARGEVRPVGGEEGVRLFRAHAVVPDRASEDVVHLPEGGEVRGRFDSRRRVALGKALLPERTAFLEAFLVPGPAHE